jgi:hypothetical protein
MAKGTYDGTHSKNEELELDEDANVIDNHSRLDNQRLMDHMRKIYRINYMTLQRM